MRMRIVAMLAAGHSPHPRVVRPPTHTSRRRRTHGVELAMGLLFENELHVGRAHSGLFSAHMVHIGLGVPYVTLSLIYVAVGYLQSCRLALERKVWADDT